MSAVNVREHEPQLQPRNPSARPGPIPDFRLDNFLQERAPSLVVREPSSATSDASVYSVSCGPKQTTGACERSVSASQNTTIPIIIGVVIPLTVAFVVLVILHRRHVKKLKKEDAEDRDKELDFGLGEGVTGPQGRKKGGKKRPEMSTTGEKGPGQRERGLSMDLGMVNPYLLPPELQQSRESLHSLSRTTNTGDDKYRATTFIPDDGSVRSPSSLRSPVDDSSSYTGSSRRRFETESNRGLLGNPRMGASTRRESPKKEIHDQGSGAGRKPNNLLAPTPEGENRDSFVSTASSNGTTAALRASNNYLGQYIRGGSSSNNEAKKEPQKDGSTATVTQIKIEPLKEEVKPLTPAIIIPDQQSRPAPPKKDAPSDNSNTPNDSAISLSGDRQPRLPQLSIIDSQGSKQSSMGPDISVTEPVHGASLDTHASSQIYSNQENQEYRPPSQQPTLPNIDVQEYQDTEDDYYDENLYDDYERQLGYDPRRLTMGVRPLPPDDPSENPEQRANRIRSFYKEYFDDSTKSPNPQMQYYDGSERFDENHAPQGYYSRSHFAPPRGPSQGGRSERHRATVSNGSYAMPPGPRAFSSASGRMGPPSQGAQPRKRLPPPKPLAVLPTPHMLQDDSYLPMAADFAPPNLARIQRAGTPDSLRGGSRPYSPSTRAHVPLVSSFDDLAVMPSPHALRKSGTFTALDFAPPKFRANDTGSDSGSIRSNKSGMSAMHLHNIRTGAYRVSRIPKEVGGTKGDFAKSLKPQWDMNR